MTRKLDDWLSSYIEFTKGTEPPLSYHTWAGISIIASTLQRRCFIQWGHNQIFPNNYIILIGPSGQTRKGDALGLARPLIEHVGIPIVANRITNEQLFRFVGDTCSSYRGPNGEARIQCAVTIFSTELHVFLGQGNIDLLAALTDWYDCLSEWEYSTKHHGKDDITGLCINILGATAPDWLPSILPHEAVGGGWTSRVLFIVEDRKGSIVADPNVSGINEELRTKLKSDLERIKLLSGEFSMSSDALESYKKWYMSAEKGMQQGHFPIPDPKFSGYCSRRATHIKKIAMALSASRGDDLIIHLEDFERARVLMEAAEKKMPRAFRGLGRARFSDLTDGVLNYIMRRGQCNRSEILQKFYRDVDAWTLEQIERVLERMKVIRVTLLTETNDAQYTFVGAKEEDQND